MLNHSALCSNGTVILQFSIHIDLNCHLTFLQHQREIKTHLLRVLRLLSPAAKHLTLVLVRIALFGLLADYFGLDLV